MLSPGCALSHPGALEEPYLPCVRESLGKPRLYDPWSCPSKGTVGSSKDDIYSESHPLDIGISDFIGAVLVLFLATRKHPDKKQLKGDGVYLVHDSRS